MWKYLGAVYFSNRAGNVCIFLKTGLLKKNIKVWYLPSGNILSILLGPTQAANWQKGVSKGSDCSNQMNVHILKLGVIYSLFSKICKPMMDSADAKGQSNKMCSQLSVSFVDWYHFFVYRTALMLAALGRHTDCVHILLEKGAKADAADKKGFTALHRAVSIIADLMLF